LNKYSRFLTIGILALGFFSSILVTAAEDPLVLRRQTLIVRDIDKSLAVYRDAIGMTVIYDQIIKRAGAPGEKPQEIRLVFLKATNDYIGVLGLVDYQYIDPKHPDHTKQVRQEGFTPGNAIVLFNTTELAARWERISKAPGVSVIFPPRYREYPDYSGKGIIRVSSSSFYDPDGFIVEFNQPMDEINTKK